MAKVLFIPVFWCRNHGRGDYFAELGTHSSRSLSLIRGLMALCAVSERYYCAVQYPYLSEAGASLCPPPPLPPLPPPSNPRLPSRREAILLHLILSRMS